MTGKLLTEEEVQWALASLPEVDRAALDAHIDALTEKLRESEAGAAALRRAHGEPECWKYGHPSEDCTHYSSCSELRSALSSTAGRDLLERLRLAEKELVGRRESEDAQTKAHLAAIQRAEEAEAEHAKSEKELCAADGAVSKWKERAEKAEEERDNCLFELNRIEAIPDVSQCLYGGEVADAVQAAIDYLEADLAIAIKRAVAAGARVKELEAELASKCEVATWFHKCAEEAVSGRQAALNRTVAAESRMSELEAQARALHGRVKELESINGALQRDMDTVRNVCSSMVDARVSNHISAIAEKARWTRLVHAAIDKCAAALEDVRGEVVDAAIRAASDEGVGT